MKITFLGTGTSTGIPQIGCRCETCLSNDIKDKRLRASLLIESGDTNIMIDCGPDLRAQLMSLHLSHIDGILISHEHYDHVGGLDDIRPLGKVTVYGENHVLHTIRRNMPYCFNDKKYPGVPRIHLQEIDLNAFYIDNIKIQPVRVMHAKLPILGYRIGNLAYLTDVKTIPEESFTFLKGLDVLIISSLRHQEHFSHANLEESLIYAERIKAKQTYFIHMSHDMGKHADIAPLLPENVFLAYDGLQLEI